MARKNWPAARREVEVLLAEAPLDGRALLTLGRTYVEEKAPERAMLAFESASRVDGSVYQANVELANLELQSRHYAKSAEYLEKALAVEKTDAVADALARVRALLPREAN
jgi:cytochrome c-type biogenesis protein CcmH/NrfG